MLSLFFLKNDGWYGGGGLIWGNGLAFMSVQVVQLHRDELHRDFHRDPDLAHLSDLPYWDTARPSPNATAINGRKEPLTMAQRSAPPVQYYISPPDQAIRFRSQPQR